MVLDIGMGMDVPRGKINQELRKEELVRVIKHVVGQEQGKKIRRKAIEMSERMKKIEGSDMNWSPRHHIQ